MDPGSPIIAFIADDLRPLILWLLVLVFLGGIVQLSWRWTRRHWKPAAGDRILFLVAVAFLIDALAHYILDRFGITVSYIGGPLFDQGRRTQDGWFLNLLLTVRLWHLALMAVFAALYPLLNWNAKKGPDAPEPGLPPSGRRQTWTQRLTGFLSALVLVYFILAIFSIALANRAAVLTGG